jgi:hypothetical protein
MLSPVMTPFGGQGTPGTTFGELQPTVTIGGAPAGYSSTSSS